MAGDWIKMRKTLPTDPRIVRIMSALKADRFRTLGGVFAAWCLFDDQTEDGRLDGYTPEVFDEVIGFPGLSRAMAAVGWLEIGKDYLAAPRFSEHNGKTAKRRASEAVRKMSARNADTERTEDGTESAIEKRREEKNNKQTKHALGDKYDDEFWELLKTFRKQSQETHNWIAGDDVVEAWLYELTRHPVEEAKLMLRFSTFAGSKKPITNGDHKAKPKASGRGRRKMEILGAE